MSIPRRRRTIRTVIADLGRAVSELEARVDALEQECPGSEWLLEEDSWAPPSGNIGIGTNADGNIGIGSSAPTVTIPAETLVNLIKAAPINTSMSEGNVGIGSTATDGNIGVGTSSGNVGGTAPEANVGIGSTGTDGNVGVGSSADGNVGVGT
jgi:hypothetical protein